MHYLQTESWGYHEGYMAAAARLRRRGSRNMSMGSGGAGVGGDLEGLEKVARVASESAVVIFSVSSCCMCHALKRLFCGMGVNPRVYELDHDPTSGADLESALIKLLQLPLSSTSSNSTMMPPVPVVFIGGKLIGSMDRVMASLINGTLVPLLKDAGALWL